MNTKGQLSVEYIYLLIIMLIIATMTANIIQQEKEENTILTAAQIGAKTGTDKNAYAMYYNDTFNTYQQENPKLLNPTQIKIIQTQIKRKYNQTIEIEITAHTNRQLTTNEKYIIGSRINYYARKSITETFNQEQTDTYYNPAKSTNYLIKTNNVRWV